VKIRVLGSYGSRLPGFFTSCLLLNDNLLLDAGTVTSSLSLAEQAAVTDVLLTHAHLDHMVDLAFLVDNVLTLQSQPLRVWAPAPVLQTLRDHLFNDQVWPDFTRLPTAEAPALKFCALVEGESVEIAGLEIDWARTCHPVYTAGYCLSDAQGSVLFSGDTSGTEQIWTLGRRCANLKAAFIETSFPNRLQKLADASGHLTPSMLCRELAKFDRSEVPVKIFHIKPQFLEEVVMELEALGEQRLEVLHGGETFRF